MCRLKDDTTQLQLRNILVIQINLWEENFYFILSEMKQNDESASFC